MRDLIDRQAALNFKVSHGLNVGGILYVPYAEIKKYLGQLPSAKRKGHWKHHLELYGMKYECTICKSCYELPYSYCPSCGARMEIEE